jgi:hypothetical protein
MNAALHTVNIDRTGTTFDISLLLKADIGERHNSIPRTVEGTYET